MHQRLARPQGDAPEAELHALTRERRLHEVVLADRGAAERDEKIGAAVAGGRDAALEVGEACRGRCRDRAPRRRHARGERGEGIEVGGDDLVRPCRLAGPDELVAGGEDRDARPAAHRQARVAHGGGEREAARIETLPGGKERVAGAEVEPARAHEAPRRGGVEDGDGVAVASRILLDDDRVGAVRHRRAGEDADRLARRHDALESRARRGSRRRRATSPAGSPRPPRARRSRPWRKRRRAAACAKRRGRRQACARGRQQAQRPRRGGARARLRAPGGALPRREAGSVAFGEKRLNTGGHGACSRPSGRRSWR